MQKTNLNVSPYYDDFSEDSLYHRVLFTVALLDTSGTPVAFEVAPVIVLFPPKGIVCFHVASVPWLS